MTTDLRKIDALVAEKVFGLNLDVFGIFYNGSEMRARDRFFDSVEDAQHYIDAVDEREMPAHKSHGKVEIRPCRKAPDHYSSDPAAAKQVREKLAEKWHWQMFSPFGKVPLFSFGMYPKGDAFEVFVYIAHGESEELATCLCALKAHGIEL